MPRNRKVLEFLFINNFKILDKTDYNYFNKTAHKLNLSLNV